MVQTRLVIKCLESPREKTSLETFQTRMPEYHDLIVAERRGSDLIIIIIEN